MASYINVLTNLCGWLVVFSILRPYARSDNSELRVASNIDCICPGEVLTFNCTVVNGGNTIWSGTAFNCPSRNNEINLRHSLFSSGGASGQCNGGAINGQSIGVTAGNCFNSELDVVVTNELHNKTINCRANLEEMIFTVGEATITVLAVAYQQQPYKVELTHVNEGTLTFNWNPGPIVQRPSCQSIEYNINFTCGTCTVSSNAMQTSALCSNLVLPSMCDFTVQRVVCGQALMASNPVRIALKVPEVPVVEVIPIYDSTGTNNVTKLKLFVKHEESFNITDGVSGTITNYEITFAGSVNPLIIPRNYSCMEIKCEYIVDITSSCSSSRYVDIFISAFNGLGSGPSTSGTLIGCMNEVVRVHYDSASSTIVCQFLDPTDTTLKSCSVEYGQCTPRILNHTAQGNSTPEDPNFVSLNVNSSLLDCYAATAKTDVLAIIVVAQGMDTVNDNINTDETRIIVAVSMSIVVLLMIAVVAVVAVAIAVVVVRHQVKRSQMLNALDYDVISDKEMKNLKKESDSEKGMENLTKVDTEFREEAGRL